MSEFESATPKPPKPLGGAMPDTAPAVPTPPKRRVRARLTAAKTRKRKAAPRAGGAKRAKKGRKRG